MNQRRDARSQAPTIVLVVVFALLVAFAGYWFLIRDDSDDKSTGSKKPTTVAARTFTAPGNSFSFKYPGNFVETTGPRGYVWIAGVGTYDILSVKRIANKPTSPARLDATIPDTLRLDPSTTIDSHGTENHAGLEMVTYAISATFDGKPVKVNLYYFTASHVTWQLACESQARANVINAACASALQSFKVPTAN